MSEFGNSHSEVNNSEIKSTDVNETTSIETGGDASERTQEAVNEQANESGGFEHDEIKATMEDDDSDDDLDMDENDDESQEVGFDGFEDKDSTDTDPKDIETEEAEKLDEDKIGFDDEDFDEVKKQTEHTDAELDDNEVGEDEYIEEEYDEEEDYLDEGDLEKYDADRQRTKQNDKESERKDLDDDFSDTERNSESAEKSKNGDNKQLSQEEIEARKQKIKENIEKLKKSQSGYQAWEKGDSTYQNRSEAKLSSKNFDRLMQERGLDKITEDNGKTVAENIKSSFDGKMTVTHGYEGDRYTMTSGDKKASGNFLADQSARDLSADEKKEKYALPPENSAAHIRDVQLAKEQYIISGKVAPQEDFAKKAGDGISREGGATQYVTDGGYKGGAVKDAYQDIDTVKAKMSPEERNYYESINTSVSEINGREALVRNDIDYDKVDSKGRTNLDRMSEGLAPLDSSGKPIELHHMGQKMDAPLVELTREEHRGKGVDTILHDKNVDSDIYRKDFAKERTEYWKARAEQIKMERGVNE